MRFRNLDCVVVAAAILAGSATSAEAYLGPGAGLSAIGSVVSVISAIILAIAGFVWYPIKRLFKRSATAQPVKMKDSTETDCE